MWFAPFTMYMSFFLLPAPLSPGALILNDLPFASQIASLSQNLEGAETANNVSSSCTRRLWPLPKSSSFASEKSGADGDSSLGKARASFCQSGLQHLLVLFVI